MVNCPSPALLEANERLRALREKLAAERVGADGEAPQPGGNGPAELTPPTLPEAIPIYPDLALALLRTERVATGRLWLLLRLLDREGRGWVETAEVREALAGADSAWRLCTGRYLRRLLTGGEGLFWERRPLCAKIK